MKARKQLQDLRRRMLAKLLKLLFPNLDACVGQKEKPVVDQVAWTALFNEVLAESMPGFREIASDLLTPVYTNLFAVYKNYLCSYQKERFLNWAKQQDLSEFWLEERFDKHLLAAWALDALVTQYANQFPFETVCRISLNPAFRLRYVRFLKWLLDLKSQHPRIYQNIYMLNLLMFFTGQSRVYLSFSMDFAATSLTFAFSNYLAIPEEPSDAEAFRILDAQYELLGLPTAVLHQYVMHHPQNRIRLNPATKTDMLFSPAALLKQISL